MQTSYLVLCILGFTLVSGHSFFHHGRHRGGFVGLPNVDQSLEAPDLWFSQKLDHFSTDDRRWQQRYFFDSTFYKSGGPVFIQIGGEGPASSIWLTANTTWMKYAQEYHAACYMLEHRYYGNSHPTVDTSTENLKYLNSEQALADVAAFYQNISTKHPNAKLVVFGGSYSGSLAAWFRLKYPHLAVGAVATSAPINAVINFYEYLEVVQNSLDSSKAGSACTENIKLATKSIEQMLDTSTGPSKLKELFRLCKPLDVKIKNDIANFYSSLADNFNGVVQYNKDNRKFEGGIGTNITIDTLCDIMTSKTGLNGKAADPLNNYASVNSLLMKTYQVPCLDFDYAAMINSMKNTSWNSTGVGGRQWFYQTCTEFGFYQTSDSSKQPFGNHFPLSFSLQQCTDVFGSAFDLDSLTRGVTRTNTMYGGLDIHSSNIVFPNGSIDPWHALGVVKNLTNSMPAIYIKGTAHCANMYPAAPSDPQQLELAREEIGKLIGQWLS